MPHRKERADPANQESNEDALDRLTDFNSAAFGALVKSGEAYAKAYTTLNAQLMSFVNMRWDRDIKLSDALLGCENLTSAVSLQEKWARQATEDYISEANKILEHASDLARKSWEPLYENWKASSAAKKAAY